MRILRQPHTGRQLTTNQKRFLFLSFLARVHALFTHSPSTMPLTLTEEFIIQKLQKALKTASPSSDGFSEVDLTDAAVRLAEAVNSYRANLQLVRAADEVAKKTIDLLA